MWPIFAKKTTGFSGADIKALLNSAAMTAAFSNKDQIDNETLSSALSDLMLGKTNGLNSEDINLEYKQRKAFIESAKVLITQKEGLLDNI